MNNENVIIKPFKSIIYLNYLYKDLSNSIMHDNRAPIVLLIENNCDHNYLPPTKKQHSKYLHNLCSNNEVNFQTSKMEENLTDKQRSVQQFQIFNWNWLTTALVCTSWLEVSCVPKQFYTADRLSPAWRIGRQWSKIDMNIWHSMHSTVVLCHWQVERSAQPATTTRWRNISQLYWTDSSRVESSREPSRNGRRTESPSWSLNSSGLIDNCWRSCCSSGYFLRGGKLLAHRKGVSMRPNTPITASIEYHRPTMLCHHYAVENASRLQRQHSHKHTTLPPVCLPLDDSFNRPITSRMLQLHDRSLP